MLRLGEPIVLRLRIEESLLKTTSIALVQARATLQPSDSFSESALRAPTRTPIGYFRVLYLVQLAKEEGVEIPDRVRECLDAIERERKRGKDDAQ